MAKRRFDNDPTPEETLERTAAAVSALIERVFESEPAGSFADMEKVYERIPLADIRREVAVSMNAAGDRFSSDYRHEETPMHTICLHLLGSTVGLNWLADDLRAQPATDERFARVADSASIARAIVVRALEPDLATDAEIRAAVRGPANA